MEDTLIHATSSRPAFVVMLIDGDDAYSFGGTWPTYAAACVAAERQNGEVWTVSDALNLHRPTFTIYAIVNEIYDGLSITFGRAQELVMAAAEQISTDPELWDPAAETATEQGKERITEQYRVALAAELANPEPEPPMAGYLRAVKQTVDGSPAWAATQDPDPAVYAEYIAEQEATRRTRSYL